MELNLDTIKKAQNNIKTVVRKTPLFYSSTFSRKTGYEVYLKCENKQKTGAFKLRGAYNKIVSLTEEERKRGSLHLQQEIMLKVLLMQLPPLE